MLLTRPLVFFDLETTGPNPASDRIVQFAALKRLPDGTTKQWETLVKPPIPIPPEATEVHGISDETVASAPTFFQLARGIQRALDGCDLAGYNARRFDVPCLRAEFERVKLPWSLDGVRVIDPLRIFTSMEPRDLAAAANFFLGCDHVGAHNAMADVQVTAAVFDAQLEKYQLPGDIGALAEFCAGDAVDLEGKLKWRGDAIAIGFGAQKGKTLKWLAENDQGFLQWMLREDFAPEVKRHIEAALQGSFERRAA